MTAVFSSAGNLGGVGTPKDSLNNSSNKTIGTITSTETGTTSFIVLEVTKLVITTSAQTLTAGTASSEFTVQAQDAIGGHASSADRAIDLSSDSSTGTFSATSNGTFTSTLSRTISNGSNSTTFFYKDTVSGTPTITAAENLSSLGWTDATQQQTVNPGALTSTDVEPESLNNNAVGDVDVSFTTVNPLGADGKIVVTFPSSFTISSGGDTAIGGDGLKSGGATNGGATVSDITGQVVTITRDNDGTAIAASTAVTVELTNIKNRSTAGSTGTYSIKTTTSGDVTIDEDASVSADTIVQDPNQTTSATSTATLSDSFDLGFPRTSTATLSDSFALGFPRTSTATLSDIAQSTATFGRTSTATLSDTVDLGIPRTSTATLSDSFGLGFPRTSTSTLASTAQSAAIFGRTSTATASDTAQNAASFGGTSTATLGDSFLLGLPRTSTSTLSDTSQSAATFGRTSTATPGDTDQSAASFGRASTATLGDSFGLGLLRTSTATLGDSFGLGLPRTSTATLGDSFGLGLSQTSTATLGDSFGLGFPRTSTATLADSFGLGLPRTSTATLGDSLGLGLPQTSTATLGDSFGLGLPRTSTATLGDSFGLGLPQTSTTTLGDSFDLGFPRTSTATVGDSFGLGFARISTATLGDSFGLGLPRISRVTLGDSFGLGLPRISTATLGDAFGLALPRASEATLGDSFGLGIPSTSTATFSDTASITTSAVGALTATNVEPESLVAGTVGNVDVSFKLVNTLPKNGKIVITLPSGFTISSGASTGIGGGGTSFDGGESVSISGQTVTITRDNTGNSVGAGTTVTIELTNIKNPTATGSTGTYSIKTTNSSNTTIDEDTSVNADTITAEATTTTDTTTTSTTGAVTTVQTVRSADLKVAKTGSPGSLILGNNLTYTLTVTNNGPDNATGVTVSDTLPTGVSFVSASTSRGSCGGTATVACNLGTLGPSQSATVAIVVNMNTVGSVTNTASVGGDRKDSVSSNNTSTVTTLVRSPLTVALTYSPDRSVRAGDTVIVTATFNQAITGTPTIAVDTTGTDLNPTAMTASADGTVWTFSYVVPAGSDGSATVSIAGAADADGNSNEAATNNSIAIDTVGPTVALSYEPNRAVRAGETLIITATFSQAITGTPTIAISTTGTDLNSTAMTPSADGKVWTFSYVVPTGSDGTATVTIAGATDEAGNPNDAATDNTFAIGSVGPTVALTYDPDRALGDADTLTITATFSEPVTGTPTIAIDTQGTDLTATAMTDSGAGTVWTFSYDVPAWSDGTATVTIAGAADAAGNPNGVATNNTFTIDNTPPTLALSYNPDRAVGDADTLTITATFSEPVTGTPTIAIDTPGTDLTATAMTGSGAGTVWTFSYDVPAGSDGTATVTIAGAGTRQATVTG